MVVVGSPRYKYIRLKTTHTAPFYRDGVRGAYLAGGAEVANSVPNFFSFEFVKKMLNYKKPLDFCRPMLYNIGTNKREEVITMKRNIMSQHVLNDRMERFQRIAMTIGFGERIIRTVPNRDNPGTVCCLTETGVIIVRVGDEDGMIVTAFVPTMARVRAQFFCEEGYMPTWLASIVRKNEKRKELHAY